MRSLKFSVDITETNEYMITEEEFNKLNLENDLKMDFENLSSDDIEVLYSYLGPDNITDSTCHNSTFWTEDVEIIDLKTLKFYRLS